MVKIKLIPNEDLDIEKIPNPEDQSNGYQDLWEEFALTINAYEACGDFEAASELSSKVLKDPINASLTNLRCALFVLQRHHRWNFPYSDPEDKRVVDLLKLIRDKVKNGELE